MAGDSLHKAKSVTIGVEQKIKFEYTRATKCYLDLLLYIADSQEFQIEICREFPNLLEAGASSKNVLFLLELGLSRTTSIQIKNIIGDRVIKDLDEMINWILFNFDLLKNSLNKIIHQELTAVLNNGGLLNDYDFK